MADPFVGEIRIISCNFAPKGWAFCDGQILPLSQNTALFSLLGTTYGGDGKSTFALPNLQGRAPMHPGQGPGLSLHDLGETGGEETVTLVVSEIPLHSHPVTGSSGVGTLAAPSNTATWGATARGKPKVYALGAANNLAMNPAAVSANGGGQPHNNLQPYLTLNFVIALQGVYPPRS